MTWKNFGKWLAIMTVGAVALLPREGKAWQDMIEIRNSINKGGADARFDELKIGHYYLASEGLDSYDRLYSYPALWAGEWAPKITTQISGNDYDGELRSTNSVNKFESNLAAVIQDSQQIKGVTLLGINAYDTATYDFFDPKRHYVSEYVVFSNFIDNAITDFCEKRNTRYICTNANVTYYWNGPTNLNIQTTTNGTFNFGKYTQFCDWNQLTSSSSGNGSNSFSNSEIMDYNSSRTGTLNAATGGYVDFYVLTRTDNTGLVSVVTNDVSPRTNRVELVLDNIKGSNAVFASYGAPSVTLTQSSPYSTPTWSSTNVNYGTTNALAIGTATNIVDIVAGATRVRRTGATIKGNAGTIIP